MYLLTRIHNVSIREESSQYDAPLSAHASTSGEELTPYVITATELRMQRTVGGKIWFKICVWFEVLEFA